jgi:hypothetical protein
MKVICSADQILGSADELPPSYPTTIPCPSSTVSRQCRGKRSSACGAPGYLHPESVAGAQTSDFEIPEVTANAATRSSTPRAGRRAHTALMITECSAVWIRRRRSTSHGKKEPNRSFGILISTSPLVVEIALDRCRSCGWSATPRSLRDDRPTFNPGATRPHSKLGTLHPIPATPATSFGTQPRRRCAVWSVYHGDADLSRE